MIGPARADVYWGAGDAAGRIAGRVQHQGRFTMLLPRELDIVAAGKAMPLPPLKPPSPRETVAKNEELKQEVTKNPNKEIAKKEVAKRYFAKNETLNKEIAKRQVAKKEEIDRIHGHSKDGTKPQAQKTSFKGPSSHAQSVEDQKKSTIKPRSQTAPPTRPR